MRTNGSWRIWTNALDRFADAIGALCERPGGGVRMCLGESDRGGPRRCSGDALAAYEAASEAVDRLDEEAADLQRRLAGDDDVTDAGCTRAGVIVLRGLPGAGKSTWAAAWQAADPDRRVVVNRDELRHKLFGRYSGLTQEQEALITQVQRRDAAAALQSGKAVVVDDTNLKADFVQAWADMADRHGLTHEVRTIGTSLSECLRRNKLRGDGGGRSVPEEVIVAMSEAVEPLSSSE